ncbi:MAG: endonuclease [Sphingobacteriales bacterium]|nr:MAG: endonuclease [Sphingobacteriales bacterium]
MPEGPSILILKELTQQFEGRKVLAVTGTGAIDKHRALNKKVVAIKTWGKHFLICFSDFTIRVHLMLFGSYRINEERKVMPKLGLEFTNGTLNFYACSLKIIDEDLDEVYDWSADIMSKKWDATTAKKKLKEHPDMLVCDALMDQQIFSGSGNIIKNEVLFNLRLHPLNKISDLPARKLTELTKEPTAYSFNFLKWKKADVLKKHWQAYAKKKCPRCDIPLIKKILGKSKRRTFYCTNCQIRHAK